MCDEVIVAGASVRTNNIFNMAVEAHHNQKRVFNQRCRKPVQIRELKNGSCS
jgi:hypothetical protein